MNTNIVRIENLTKKYNDQIIFKNLNVDFVKDRITVLLGPSGVGKTTLLRCISGLEDVSSGNIIIDGEDYIINGEIKDRTLSSVGFVFQNFNLFPNLKVIDNLLIVNDDIKLANYWLDELDILEKANMFPFMLSGGQKQRVAIARALMLKPKILCFDEPTSSLDSSLTKSVANIIKRLKVDTTVIIITHDEIFAEIVSDTIIDFKTLIDS